MQYLLNDSARCHLPMSHDVKEIQLAKLASPMGTSRLAAAAHAYALLTTSFR
jgi:hypothetical protein